VFRARARNYPSALQAALFPDDVPVAVYDGLISAVGEGIPPLVRYYELRRRVLGLDELHATIPMFRSFRKSRLALALMKRPKK